MTPKGDGCEVGPRRWNNLRDQIVTLFRFARSERYLPKDRTTEAEDVAKMKVARKTVEVFTSEELQTILANCRLAWSPWIVLSAFAGIRTFEVLRMDWSNVRWEQKLIDLPPEVTKVNERRIIPMCDALIEALAPWQQTTGRVCQAKVPQHEIEQIAAKAKNAHPGFRWKHNALRHAYGSYRTALTQNVPCGFGKPLRARSDLGGFVYQLAADRLGVSFPKQVLRGRASILSNPRDFCRGLVGSEARTSS
jgi:integrase